MELDKYDSRHEIEPKCFNNQQNAFAVTNLGELIPCCWCDNQHTRKEPRYKDLLAVSKIDDYESLDEIILQDEWVKFFEDLKEGKGFGICHHICKKRETDSHKKQIVLSADGKPEKVDST